MSLFRSPHLSQVYLWQADIVGANSYAEMVVSPGVLSPCGVSYLIHRINRAARLFSIPDPIRDAVHDAHEYRNSVVHPGGARIASLSIRQARSVLNRFLKPLP